MIRWLRQAASDSDGRVVCPNCQNAIPVRRVLVAQTPRGMDATLLACVTCGACFFENVDTGAYEEDPPGGSAALAFYLQQGADIGGFAMRLIGLGLPPETRYLEIGCGFGLGLDIARRALGWDVKGIDPSPFAAMGRQALDLPIERRYFGPDDSVQAEFDVVHASEFLEHVPAPLEVLRAIRAALRPGGTLLLTTPAAEMIQPTTSKGILSPLLSVGWHLVIQSAESLTGVLYRAGFHDVQVVREGAQLVARAGARPKTVVSDRTLYQSWLRACASTLPTESDLCLGLRSRLFRELANIGDTPAANEAWDRLNHAVETRFGRRLESWCDTPTSEPEASLNDLFQREPLCLAGALLLRGWLLRQRGETADAYFVGARDAARRLRNALHAIGSDDGDAEDLCFAAERELIILAAERGEADVVDRIVSLEVDWGGRRIPELRRRCFVPLVNHRQLQDAQRLADVVNDVVQATARMEILSHEDASILFCAANAELQTCDGRINEALTWLRTLRQSLVQGFLAGQKDSAAILFWPVAEAEALALRLSGREKEAADLLSQVAKEAAQIAGFPIRRAA
jgi:2-polyprenyl-3-methyl-5-hydroxy-6-metoxy-1,4-benzoquinol methylase